MSIVRLTIVLSLSAMMFNVSGFSPIIIAGRCCKFSTNVKNSALSGIFKQRRGPRCRLGEKMRKDENDTKDRPFTLPPGAFRPKQSLGQNFLSDQNYVLKICDAFQDKRWRIYGYIYSNICIYTSVYIYIYIYVYIYAFVYIYMHIYMFTYIYTYIYRYSYMYTYVYIYIYVYIYVYICT
jgi:hypothetical protein